MKYKAAVISAILISFSLNLPALAKGAKSFIPATPPAFLVTYLDLASFRNSLGPRRNAGDHTFADLNISPTKVSATEVVFDSPDWYYSVRIIGRGDFNGDGIEDLEVCFVDRAKEGSYDTQDPLILSRYNAEGYMIALNFSAQNTDTCESIKH